MVPTAARDQLSRKAIVGISTGSAAFTMLISIVVIYFVLRRRRKRAVAVSKDATMPILELSETRPFSNISIQEIGPQIVQELHASSHHIELLDKQAPSGSGMDIKELPDWRKSIRPALLPTAIKDHSIPALRERAVSSTNIRRSEEEPYTSLVDRSSNISILSMNLGPHRATLIKQDTMETGITNIRARKNSSKVTVNNNVIQPLPQAPRVEGPSGQKHSSNRSHLTTPISESIQMLPVSHITARELPTQELDSMADDPRMSPTYATVFNVEAYQDSATASPALSPTHSLSKTT